MDYLKQILLTFSASLLCFSSAFAMDQNFKIDDYQIQVFVEEAGSRVEAHGQISGGKPCGSLEIDMDCINTNGEEANIIAIVRNAGGAGSRLFRASKTVRSTKDDWPVRDVYVWCIASKNLSITETSSSINVIGRGQRASQLFNLRKGLTIFKFLHRGKGACAIWLKDKNGRDVELIANDKGKFTGSKSISVRESDKFLVDVEADSVRD
jgi:hypothetical protein